MAESIEDVRGIGCNSCRSAEPDSGGVAVERGEGGDEPRDFESGSGDETFRSWLYDCILGDVDSFAFAAAKLPGSIDVNPAFFTSSDARYSSNRSRGDLGCSSPVTTVGRGERGDWEEVSLRDLMVVGDLGLFEWLPLRFPITIADVALTCSGVGLRGAFRPSPERGDLGIAVWSKNPRATPAPDGGDSGIMTAVPSMATARSLRSSTAEEASEEDELSSRLDHEAGISAHCSFRSLLLGFLDSLLSFVFLPCLSISRGESWQTAMVVVCVGRMGRQSGSEMDRDWALAVAMLAGEWWKRP